MIEKRFKIIEEEFISYYGGCAYLISNGDCKFHVWENEEGAQKVCDKLNNLIVEKEQLKQTIDDKIKVLQFWRKQPELYSRSELSRLQFAEDVLLDLKKELKIDE